MKQYKKPSDSVQALAAKSVTAREQITDAVVTTPCLQSRSDVSSEPRVFFKCENLQPTGSFKLRGAMTKLLGLPVHTPVITASSGNHGIACSHAARETGHDLTVVLPENVDKAKLAKIQSYGTKTILHPGNSGLAEQHARSMAVETGYVYVSPYNDEMVMAGQGTIGLELLEQLPHIDNLFVSMGGGGLISGIGSVMKVRSPKTSIIGVSAINSAALAASINAGRVVETEHLETLADGCAGGMDENALTLAIATEVIDQIVYCAEAQIVDAIRQLAWTEKLVVEGAAALAFAAYLNDPDQYAGQTNVVLLCGANFDKNVIQPILAGN